ncbi:DUF2336 domain-containing protein [Maritalea porphyrae]|uniref:DUF2336 domain-containing protein n=1 Tax=Maritalea porphyrae TaxID=880732 RepID=UPI0022AEDA09|nr:DUF2336 domain-containing protein [Maritalea porphyrae]MCZ4270799.1 DUF2336 domain-containing protein [Maritalea porphyrae]
MELLSKVSSAQDNSERRQLAREVVNLFFHAGQDTTQNQRDAFGDVLCRLLSDMAQSMRIDLANKVSAQSGAPTKLVKALAVSEAEVAQPVLTRSPQLKDDDLIEVANTATTQHRLAISKREHLPECVTDSLIQFEENIVMQSVAANETARISDNGFSTLARNSGSDEQIMHALINREDLPPKTAQHILSNVDAKGKAVLEKLVISDSTLLKRLINKSKRLSSEGNADENPDRVETLALIQQIEGNYRTLEQTVQLLASQSRLKSIATVLAVVSTLPEDKVNRGIININGDFLALIARALELSFRAYCEIDALRAAQLRIPRVSTEKLHKQYEQLDPDHARSTLRMVNVIVKVS